jgi:DNA invertase Pin-like site-specific DNA recombinase
LTLGLEANVKKIEPKLNTKSTEPVPLAYSYVRFSDPDQKKGDTLRRQAAARDAWLVQHPGVALDTTLRMTDEGRSGFRRKKWDTYALAEFISHVKAGRVSPGSYLLVENLDRLSREDVGEATELFLSIVNRGIVVVQLSPAMAEFRRPVNVYSLMLAIIELARGHGESAIKSERLSAAWSNKKAQARTNGSVQTARAPEWLTVVGRKKVDKHMVGGEFKRIPERVRVVRWLFKMALEGHGLSAIIQRLLRDGVPAWGRAGKWSRSYIRKILTSRATLGEYQPRKGTMPEGDTIPGYYPQVIDPETWQQTQDALGGRRGRQGSPGKRVANLFSGLLMDARSRTRMLISWQTRGGPGNRTKARVLVSADSMEGRSPEVSFPNQVFEEAVLSLLKEVNPADLGDRRTDKVAALAEEAARLQRSIAAINADLDAHGDSPALFARLRRKEAELSELDAKLAEARRQEQNPPTVAMEEAQTLIGAARDEAKRSRLKLLLRAAVESIWVYVVPGPSWRVAAVQVFFVGGTTRTYAIMNRAAGRGRKGGWWAKSFREAGLPKGLDLRKPEHLRQLEAALTAVGEQSRVSRPEKA